MRKEKKKKDEVFEQGVTVWLKTALSGVCIGEEGGRAIAACVIDAR